MSTVTSACTEKLDEWYTERMELFWTLFFKIAPLYGLMILGYIGGRVAGISRESVAKLLLYILSPLIVFHGAYTAPLEAGNIVLPMFFFVLACGMSIGAYVLGSCVWKDNTRNIFAYAAASGNTGYFGIPVTLAVLGEKALGITVLCTMGLVLFENSLGFFLTARGSYTARQSLVRLVLLPSVYGLIVGIGLNASGVVMPEAYTSLMDNVRGAYTILGSMMVGLGIVGIGALRVDWKLLSLSWIAKFMITPLATMCLLTLDTHTLHLLSPLMRETALLLSFMPLATNTIVLATALNVQPGKAGLAVITSTIFALVLIPAMMVVVGH